MALAISHPASFHGIPAVVSHPAVFDALAVPSVGFFMAVDGDLHPARPGVRVGPGIEWLSPSPEELAP